MTNRDPELRYESPAQVFGFFCEQTLKMVHTAMPGIVISYEAEPKPRARVQPALDLLFDDGTTMPRAQILDVPVSWPTAGGYRIHMPLTAGDSVWLVFCERDITGFKQTGAAGPLASDRVLSDMDVFAIPGAAESINPPASPASTTGISIQSPDGATSIVIEDGHVTINADTVTLKHSGGTTEWP